MIIRMRNIQLFFHTTKGFSWTKTVLAQQPGVNPTSCGIQLFPSDITVRRNVAVLAGATDRLLGPHRG